MTAVDIEYLYWCTRCQQLYTFDTEPERRTYVTQHRHEKETAA